MSNPINDDIAEKPRNEKKSNEERTERERGRWQKWKRTILWPTRGLRTSIGLRSNKLIYTILGEPRWPLINPFKRRS